MCNFAKINNKVYVNCTRYDLCMHLKDDSKGEYFKDYTTICIPHSDEQVIKYDVLHTSLADDIKKDIYIKSSGMEEMIKKIKSEFIADGIREEDIKIIGTPDAAKTYPGLVLSYILSYNNEEDDLDGYNYVVIDNTFKVY